MTSIQVDATNKIGQTPLIYAVIEQHVGMIRSPTILNIQAP